MVLYEIIEKKKYLKCSTLMLDKISNIGVLYFFSNSVSNNFILSFYKKHDILGSKKKE